MLILSTEAGPTVVAARGREESADQEGGSLLLDDVEALPHSLIRFVLRSRESVLISDVDGDPFYHKDPYLSSRGVRSALCMPVLNQRELIAVLYIENRLTTEAFTPQRLDTLNAIVSQIVISLKNARLYDDLLKETVVRREVEADLIKSQERSKKSQYHANIGLWEANTDESKIYWSEFSGPLFGYPEGEVETTYDEFLAIVHPEDHEKVRAAFFSCLGGQEYHVEHRVIWPDGSVHWLAESGDAVREECGKVKRIFGVVQDITQRREEETRHRERVQQLHQAQKMESVGQLTSGIAHDFRNILGVIIGYTDTLAEALKDLGQPAWFEHLDGISSASDKARQLISQLLTFSRGDSVEPQRLNARAVVEESLSMIKSLLPAEVVLTSTLDDDLPNVLADPIQLNQVILNCCINARDAMEGQGALDISLSRFEAKGLFCSSCHRPFKGSYLELCFTDTGSGMSPDTIKSIFEPFFSTKAPDHGSGMGLSVVHGIMEGIQGHIIVESTLGVGSQFRLFFPVSPPQTASLREEIRSTSRPANILIVDDNILISRLFMAALMQAGHTVFVEDSSPSALARFQKTPHAFDLVITDQSMPNLLGIDLADQIANIRPELPIVLCTGSADELDLETVRRIGVKKILLKPVRMSRLCEVAEEFALRDPRP